MATAAMLIMAIAIILFIVFYQKKMLQEQLTRQSMEGEHRQKMMVAEMQSRENERGRLSKEIHDGVGVMLQALRATTFAVAKNASEEDRRELNKQINEITETVRSMAYNLMPPSLEKFGLRETLDEYCSKLNKYNPEIKFTFLHEGQPGRLDSWQQLTLYRMVQESTTNTTRHADASEATVAMIWSSEILTLTISDNGKGFDFPNEENKNHGRHGLGLYSLENRASLLGATIKYTSNIPRGTLLTIYLPLHG
jgi:two-component system, NarL family, sensor kinase